MREWEQSDAPARSTTLALSDLPLGVAAQVVDVHEPGVLGERLLEMGLTAGTTVWVVRRGLFGDPIQISLRGYMLTLRRAQAHSIGVIYPPLKSV